MQLLPSLRPNLLTRGIPTRISNISLTTASTEAKCILFILYIITEYIINIMSTIAAITRILRTIAALE
jgi:hypothetical protein